MTPKVFWSPKACTMAVRVAVHELGLPCEFIEATPELRASPEYRRLHPLGKVPVLITEQGETITEITAVLTYLAGLREDPKLIPEDPVAKARCYEFISLFTTEMHAVFIQSYEPHRLFPYAEGHLEALSAAGKQRVHELLQITDARLVHDYIAGSTFSIADAMLLVPIAWALGMPVDLAKYPRLQGWTARALRRPSILKTLADEKLPTKI